MSKIHEAICSVSGKPPYCLQCGAKMVSVPGLGSSSWCCENGCDDKYTISQTANSLMIMQPDYKWKLTIPPNALVVMTVDAPNFFHRLMVKIILGWKWEKL
jgi:hypothetical protein